MSAEARLRAKADATKQSMSQRKDRKNGLLRGACHRAALRVDPLARNDVEELCRPTGYPPSRQLPPAAQSDVLLGFQLRHFEQTHQYAEPVAPRQQRQIGHRIGDEARSLVWPAIPRRIV